MRLFPARSPQRVPHRPGRVVAGAPGTETKALLLRESELFNSLTAEQMKHVEAVTTITTVERATVIYQPSKTGEALFLLKRGKVYLYRISPEGKKLVTAVVEAGTFFGEMAIAGQSMGQTYAGAAEDSMLCVMSRHDLEDLLVAFPHVAVRLIHVLSRRIEELESRLEESSLRGMVNRVAAALLRRSESTPDSSVRVTHQELADIVGTYRETVTRVLDELKAEGAVGLGRGRITVLKSDRVAALAAREEDSGHF